MWKDWILKRGISLVYQGTQVPKRIYALLQLQRCAFFFLFLAVEYSQSIYLSNLAITSRNPWLLHFLSIVGVYGTWVKDINFKWTCNWKRPVVTLTRLVWSKLINKRTQVEFVGIPYRHEVLHDLETEIGSQKTHLISTGTASGTLGHWNSH